MAENSRRATILDVARLAGVSDGTVSNVLNRPHLVRDSTRRSVLEAMQLVNFVPNAAARALRAGRTRSFGLAVLDLGNPFFADIAAGAEEIAHEAGALVSLFDTALDREREERLLHRLAEGHVDGLVITPGDVHDPLLDGLAANGLPVVVLAREVPDRRHCAVRTDYEEAGRLALTHLLELGHRRIAFVGPPHDERRAGALPLAEQAGVALQLVPTRSTGLPDGRAAGAALLAMHPDERPTAVFCMNDPIALGLLQIVTQERLAVPDDLAVVGCDGTDLVDAASAMSLTTIHQPALELGRRAMDLLLHDPEAVRRHEDVVFRPTLVVRGSTDPALRYAAPPPRRSARQPARP